MTRARAELAASEPTLSHAARAAIPAPLRGLAGRSPDIDTVIASPPRGGHVTFEAIRDSCLGRIPRRGPGEADDVAHPGMFPCADLVRNIAGKALSADANVQYL